MRMREFMKTHYRHFNAREMVAASQAWVDLLDRGGKMFLAMGGAMSTAELGISLAAMIRAGKVSAVCTTGANLEEDVFNLLAHNEYALAPDWRDLTPQDEQALYDKGFNRVTDTCIPETMFRDLEERLHGVWRKAAEAGVSKFETEFILEALDDPSLPAQYQIPAENSWLLAAKQMRIPIFTPGWEDSTTGNMFTASQMQGKSPGFDHRVVKTGTEQMQALAQWYLGQAAEGVPIGFFQIGGGIAGDFPICLVPMLIQDLERADTPFWAYFCQISDSTASYGSYSGAFPREKITWGKLDAKTPAFSINSDATIVAPLMFSYVLDL
jgi:deoxyhypusine synthase